MQSMADMDQGDIYHCNVMVSFVTTPQSFVQIYLHLCGQPLSFKQGCPHECGHWYLSSAELFVLTVSEMRFCTRVILQPTWVCGFLAKAQVLCWYIRRHVLT